MTTAQARWTYARCTGLHRKTRNIHRTADRLARLEIQADIGHIHTKPGSDEAQLLIRFTGRDTPLLTANDGRVLDAIETLAADVLGLSDAESETLRFDAGDFLADRERRLRKAASAAIGRVRFTGTPHVFPPMSGRDRRLLEQTLVTSGLYFETLGTQSTRWIVLLPKDVTPEPATASAQCSTGP